MDKSEIALQLTLKAIERMNVSHAGAQSSYEQTNSIFSNQVVDFYNNIYNKLTLDNTINV